MSFAFARLGSNEMEVAMRGWMRLSETRNWGMQAENLPVHNLSHVFKPHQRA